jgi:hypothetical protein
MPQAPAHTRRGAEAQLAANPPRRKAGEATGQTKFSARQSFPVRPTRVMPPPV